MKFILKISSVISYTKNTTETDKDLCYLNSIKSKSKGKREKRGWQKGKGFGSIDEALLREAGLKAVLKKAEKKFLTTEGALDIIKFHCERSQAAGTMESGPLKVNSTKDGFSEF